MDLSIKSYRFYEQPIPATVRWNLSLYEYMGREVDPENIDDMVCMFQFQEGESILVLGEVDSDAYESGRGYLIFSTQTGSSLTVGERFICMNNT